jgi:hypothetical protein
MPIFITRFFQSLSQTKRWQLHWLDGVVLAVIIISLTGLLWSRSERKTQWIPVQIKVSQDEWWWGALGPENWYLRNLQPGTEGFNSFGAQIAEVEKVELIEMAEARNQAMVTVKLKVSFDAKKQQYFFGFQPLEVGRGIELSFNKQQVKGLVTSIDQPALPVVEKSVRLFLNRVDPTVAKTFKVGMQSLTSTGEVIAEITELKVSQALDDNFSDIRGQIVVVPNPQYDDIVAVVKLRLSQDGDSYYYADGQPVKVGGFLTVQFPQNVLAKAQVLEWVTPTVVQ